MKKIKILTNLQAAQKFFMEVFGAVCFYNDHEDGYAEFEDNRKIETLSIYFANKIDCSNEDRNKRLTRAAGENFYEHYVGARGTTVCGLMGGLTLAAYYFGGKPIAILPYGYSGLAGGVSFAIDYFCGKNIDNFADDLRYFTKDLPTNCELKIKKGMPIMDTVDNFLTDNAIAPLRAGFNFIAPVFEAGKFKLIDRNAMQRFVREYYNAEAENISQIAEMRKESFFKLFANLSKEALQTFEEDMAISDVTKLKDESDYND